MLCSLSSNDLNSAMTVVEGMSEKSRAEPQTAYLTFKLAIRSSNRDLVTVSLDSLSASQNHNDYLSACIAESQQIGDIFTAIDGLKRLICKYEYKLPSPVHLPALLRSTIRLLYSLSDKRAPEGAANDTTIQDLVNVFQTGIEPCILLDTHY